MSQVKTIEKGSEKRRAIMNACLKLFNEKCFQDTSTASISQEAGVATGTLFCYFENKEELVNALYLECKEDYAAYVEKGVCDLSSFKTKIRHIWDRNLEWQMNNTEKLKFMKQVSASPFITDITREQALNRSRLISDVVKEAVDNKEVSTSSTEMLSAMITGYFFTAASFLSEYAHSKNFKKWSEESFNFMWKGIN